MNLRRASGSPRRSILTRSAAIFGLATVPFLVLLPLAAATAEAAAGPAGHAPVAPDAAVAPGLAVQGPAAVNGSPTLELGNDATNVTLANGQKWELGVVWTQLVGLAPSAAIDLGRTVTTGPDRGSEEHSWQFPVTKATFGFDAATGDGTFDTGTQTSPVATIDLSFKSTGKSKSTCLSGSETVYKGTLTGKVRLVSGLGGAGTVGGNSLSLSLGGPPEVKVDAGCVTPLPNSCVASTIWSSSDVNTHAPLVDGGMLEAGEPEFVGLERTATLAAPRGATRVDVAEADAPAPVWHPATKALSITTSPNGLMTGSGTISGGSVISVPPLTCTVSGKKFTEKLVEDSSATLRSQAGHVLTAHTSLTGTLAVANPSTPAFYEVETLQPA